MREIESRRDRDRGKEGQTTDNVGDCENFSADSNVGMVVLQIALIVLVWLSWISSSRGLAAVSTARRRPALVRTLVESR